MTYTILVLPVIENPKLSAEIYDKAQNVIKLSCERARKRAHNEDGVQLCGTKVYHEHRAGGKVTHKAMPGESITFQFHSDSKITQSDVDAMLKDKPYSAFGNGFGDFSINHKRCTILVLQKDKKATAEQMKKLAAELKRPI